MKKILTAVTCALALAGIALAQTSPKKPSGAIRENPTADVPRHQPSVAAPLADEEQKPAQPELKTRHAHEVSTIPVGTAVRIKLEKTLSTSDRENETFSGRVTHAVVVHGRTVIPVGASLSGHVVRIAEPRRIKGAPGLDLRPETVTLPNGETFNIAATVVDTGNPSVYHVNDEGRITGKGRTSTDNVELVGATGSGAVAGAVIAGGAGSLVGAAAGATVTTAHWLFKHHSAVLPAGTEIIMEFSRPMAVDGEYLKAGD